MDRERMEARAGELLALRDRFARLHLSLPPNLRAELVSLENRLGWSTMVPMSRRRRPRRYSEQQDENSFHAALDADPDDHTTRLVFADWLQERGDPRAEGYRALGQMQKYPRSVASNEPGVDNYFVPHSSASHWHESWMNQALPDDWMAVFDGPPTTPSGSRYGPSRRHVEDAAAHAFSRLPPERRHELLNPHRMGRRGGKYRYAKAERERHPAHPLIAGFPLEHALRHLANDPNANDTLRGTAKHVLTTGDTSGLWALHDLVQQHENPDGTSGHPILRAGYNFMSAADKVQLDRHTHRALTEAAEHERRNTPGPHHTEGTTNLIHDYTPEYMAGRLARGFGTRAMTPQELRNRVHNRVKELQPGTEDDAIGDSVDRHAYRHAMEFYKRNGIRHDAAERAIVNPKNNPHKEGGTARQETKTRYRRRFVVAKYTKVNRSSFIDALRRLQSSNHTALTTAARDVSKRMGIRDTHVLGALHDGPGGAVPGVAQAVYGQVAPEKVHELAAWVNGLLPNSPGYAVFHPRPTGPDTLYRIRHDGSGMDVRARLDRAGIKNRVLVPHRKGFDVLVPDKGNALSKNVDEYAQAHGLRVEASPGHFQTVGGSDQAASRATFRNKVVAGEKTNMGRTNPRRYALPHSTNPDDIGGVSGERRNQLVHPGTFVGGPVRMEPRTGEGWDTENLTNAGLMESRRTGTLNNYLQDTVAGGKLADVLDEAGQPHAPFFRHLTPSGSTTTHQSSDGTHHREFQNNPHALRGIVQGSHGLWMFRPGSESSVIVHRMTNDGPNRTTHTAVLHAPALREWAAHPKVGPSLRAHLLNAADHLESHAPPAPPATHPDAVDHNARMSRRRRLLCPS